MERRSDWYDHPEYYEAIFGTDTEKEMDFLRAVDERHCTGGSRWLEPACGAGRLVAEAARRGVDIVGYDISQPMLDYARRRLKPSWRRRVRLFQSRMESFAVPGLKGRVDLAFNLVSTFRYLGA